MNDNYQIILDKTIDNIIRNNEKPTLLLHSCCAPCSSYVLEYLSKYFFITVFYYNPNIEPIKEYEMRKSEQIRFIKELDSNIKLLDCDYDNASFRRAVEGLEQEKEGGARCSVCYKLRLEKTAQMAKELDFEYFTTTLTVSPYKNSQKINAIGAFLEQNYGVKYLYSDFKKNDGYKKSIDLSRKYNLYRQNYCGCEFGRDNHV